MIDDAQYLAWLRQPEAQRCVLAEVQAYSGGQVVSRYLSNRDYTSEPSDAPANQTYESLLVREGLPEFRASLSEAFTGASSIGYGDLAIVNLNGALDAWLDDAWDGRAAALYLGDPAWPRVDFRAILTGTIDDIYAPARDRLALKLRDKTRRLNVTAQANLIGGVTANLDQPVPLAFGQCFNAEPVLTVAVSHTYQVHDGQVNAISTVRDNGVSVAFTPTLSAGTFVLTSAPAGRITVDLQGAAPAGLGYLTKCADIVSWLVQNKADLTAAEIDSASFAAFNITCPQALNLYVRSRTNLIELIDRLVTAVGGAWYFGRDGKLQLVRLEAPSGANVLELEEDDLIEREIALSGRMLPVETLRLGYAKNWTEQSDGLAGSVTEANRALYAAPHQIAKATNAGISTTHLLALKPDVEETLITGSSDAAAEASRRATLYSSIRKMVKLKCWATPFTVNLGDRVLLTHPRFGFATGALGVVVALTERALEGTVELTLWR